MSDELYRSVTAVLLAILGTWTTLRLRRAAGEPATTRVNPDADVVTIPTPPGQPAASVDISRLPHEMAHIVRTMSATLDSALGTLDRMQDRIAEQAKTIGRLQERDRERELDHQEDRDLLRRLIDWIDIGAPRDRTPHISDSHRQRLKRRARGALGHAPPLPGAD